MGDTSGAVLLEMVGMHGKYNPQSLSYKMIQTVMLVVSAQCESELCSSSNQL